MPIYAEVEGIGKLEFPDGTDPSVIQATVKRVVQSRQQQASESKTDVMGGVKDSWLGGMVRGIRDPIDAGAQMLTRGLESVAPAGSSFESFMRGQRENVEGINKEAERDYRQNWRRGEDTGLDLGRVGGNILATAAIPTGAVGTAATMLGRAGQAARAGGVMGLMQPVNDPQSAKDFWSQKAGQGVTGAVVGGVAGPALEVGGKGLAKGAGWLAEKGRAAGANLTGETSEAAIRRILTQQGIKLGEMDEGARRALIADAQAAMKKYGGLEPKALARKADFDALGFKEPLQPWITRDPVAFTQAENLAGVKGAGDALAYTKSRLNEALKRKIDDLRPVGSGDAFASGQQAVKGITAVENAQKAAVDKLYTTFREIAPDVQGNGARFVDRVSTALDDQMVGGQLPTDFVARLQKIAAGKFPLTPSTLYQMQKAASAQNKGNPALAIFKKAVDDEFMAMAEEMGPRVGVAADVLKAARTAARQRFMAQEAVPALKAAADGRLEPERFFRDYVQGGSVSEVAAMWQALKGEGAARDAVRAQLADMLRKSAIGSSSIEEGVVSQAGLTRLLDQPGMKQKLQIILGPKALADVERVARAAENAIKQPAGSKVNNSNTSAALMSLFNRGAGIPMLGPLVAAPLRDAAQQMQAASLAKAGPSAFARRVDPWANQELQDTTKRLAGLLGGASGLLASGNLSR